MLFLVQNVMFFVVLLSLILSVTYSFRYRMQKEPLVRGLLSARMNMWMGLLLISIAVTQLTLYEMTNIRMVLGTIFLLIGLFNFFVGLRNHKQFSLLLNKSQEK